METTASTDTIVALASIPGPCAVCLLRLSGPAAETLAFRVFPALPAEGLSDRHAYLADAVDEGGQILDRCLVTLFRGPRSYTGEDVLEVSCHGGTVSPQRVLTAFRRAGCRLAAPGEFSRRAFLNGKLDLTEAEGLAALIGARSERAHQNALAQLNGALGRQLADLSAGLRDLLVQLEATLDFEEDEVPLLPLASVQARLERFLAEATALARTWDFGKSLQEGVRLVLAGRPNTGKSSLLNALLGEERAIVTAHAGTTRDLVESPWVLGGVPVTLADTAGLTQSKDSVEQMGVARALRAVRAAEVVVWVLDGSEPLTPDDRWCAEVLGELSAPVVVAVNKHDLPQQLEVEALPRSTTGAPVVFTSALTGEGVGKLAEVLAGVVGGGEAATETLPVIVSARQHDSLCRAVAAAERAHTAEAPLDMLCADVREALHALGEVTGETATEEVLSAIFDQFCIGK